VLELSLSTCSLLVLFTWHDNPHPELTSFVIAGTHLSIKAILKFGYGVLELLLRSRHFFDLATLLLKLHLRSLLLD
jgi:hypothetical protein